MIDAATIFARYTGAPLKQATTATAYAPANIALAKYWGKRDVALNLPLNSSLSVSLGDWGTRTTVAPAEIDSLTFNSAQMDADVPAARKIWAFVDLFCGKTRPRLAIETVNSIPTAAGLASSASGFAALTHALDQAFGLNLPRETLSQLARFGSGSATRSFWYGFAGWDKGRASDGSDSHGRAIDAEFAAFRVGIIPVDTGPKAHSSRDGMTHTVATSPLYRAWPAQADADSAAMEDAVKAQDFPAIGTLAEANALAMHATMMAARPALTYLKAGSWEVLERLWRARTDGLDAYATMDAGANVKLLFLQEVTEDVRSVFPTLQVINPLTRGA